MKKILSYTFFPALCLLILSFSACRSESTAVNAEVSSENSTVADTENADKNWDILSSMDVLYEEGDNYQIYTNAEKPHIVMSCWMTAAKRSTKGIMTGAVVSTSAKRTAFCS